MSNDVHESLGLSQPSGPGGHTSQPEKYSSLKNIAGIIAIFAWISGGIIFIAGMVIATNTRSRFGEPSGQAMLLLLVYLFMAVFIVVTLLAQAGVIKVLIDIEKNTRKTRE
jgi:hypothetical protein